MIINWTIDRHTYGLGAIWTVNQCERECVGILPSNKTVTKLVTLGRGEKYKSYAYAWWYRGNFLPLLQCSTMTMIWGGEMYLESFQWMPNARIHKQIGLYSVVAVRSFKFWKIKRLEIWELKDTVKETTTIDSTIKSLNPLWMKRARFFLKQR